LSNDVLLILIAGATSVITAITGIGGGMVLIAIMPGFLPAAAIVPVHAVVQLFANSSRALFGWRFLRWEFVLAFIAGSIFGGGIAAGIAREINLAYTPLFIAAYILFITWGPAPKFNKPPPGEFVIIGAIQTGLSMLVGATGPMSQAALMSRGLKRDALVVSGALMTTFTHLIKVLLFALLGFSFVEFWQLILGMSIAVTVGALIGTRIRYQVPEVLFRRILKWALTLLALRMIYLTLADSGLKQANLRPKKGQCLLAEVTRPKQRLSVFKLFSGIRTHQPQRCCCRICRMRSSAQLCAARFCRKPQCPPKRQVSMCSSSLGSMRARSSTGIIGSSCAAIR
jgi:uncharacterized membrane protein YfcA